MKALFIALVVAVAGAGAWFFWGNAGADSEELVLYGNVDIRQISLAFEGSGRVTEMIVEEGDTIMLGQVLARLDAERLGLQAERIRAEIAAREQALLRLKNGTRPEELAQARAQVASASAEAAFSARNLRRMRELFNEKVGRAVSQQDLDSAISADSVARARLRTANEALKLAEIGPRDEDIAQAAAELDAARAQLALLEHDIKKATLVAPVKSIVRSRLLEPGDMASPQRAVYLLSLTDPKWIRAYANEPQLAELREGMAMNVFVDGQEKPVPGQVGFISSVAEFTPKTVQTEELRTALLYEVRVIVQDPDNILRIGMPVTVRSAKDQPLQ